MRVIAGSARSLRLKTPEGLATRPTTDRIKETLFNMIQDRIPGASFLDLFCGSGAIGIEALSRGADRCVFVDSQASAVRCVRENLAFTRLDGRAEVLKSDAVMAIGSFLEEKAFDIVFLDPPYSQGLEKRALLELGRSRCLKRNALIIIEAAKDTDFAWVGQTPFEIFKVKQYKTNCHLFVQGKENL